MTLTDPKPLSEPARLDAAQERLKADAAQHAPQAVKAKRAKAPLYYVLRYDGDLEMWGLLTEEPILAPSRQAAISKAAPISLDREAGPLEPEQFAVVPAGEWWTKKRGLRPLDGFEEVWS